MKRLHATARGVVVTHAFDCSAHACSYGPHTVLICNENLQTRLGERATTWRRRSHSGRSSVGKVLAQGGGRSRSLAPRALATLLGRDVFPAPRLPGGHGAAPDGPDPDSGALGGKLRLFALSFLMLFVELALIRWLGANVVYLSYYSNFVLLGSFLGIGIGFLRARSRVNLFPWAPAALTLLVYFVLHFPVQVTNASAQLVFFGSQIQVASCAQMLRSVEVATPIRWICSSWLLTTVSCTPVYSM